MLLYMVVLVALARLIGGDVSCSTACARCRGQPSTELGAVYCALCRECRERRREWLATPPGRHVAPSRRHVAPSRQRNMAPARRNVAPVNQPNYYREEAYYKNVATVWNEPGGKAGCPPANCDDDGGQFAYVKVFGLKPSTCPTAPPCNSPWTRKIGFPVTRKTRPWPIVSPPVQLASCCGNPCCPMFMPMMPPSCVCPFGAYTGMGMYGLIPSIYGPNGSVYGPMPGLHNLNSSLFGPSSATVTSPAGDSPSTESSPQTEPVYLYIGIPKKMEDMLDN